MLIAMNHPPTTNSGAPAICASSVSSFISTSNSSSEIYLEKVEETQITCPRPVQVGRSKLPKVRLYLVSLMRFSHRGTSRDTMILKCPGTLQYYLRPLETTQLCTSSTHGHDHAIHLWTPAQMLISMISNPSLPPALEGRDVV